MLVKFIGFIIQLQYTKITINKNIENWNMIVDLHV